MIETDPDEPIQATPYVPEPAEDAALLHLHKAPPAQSPQKKAIRYFEFQDTDYFENFHVPSDAILAGDFHLTRGDITVIGGQPGCGKSRMLTSLAIAGKEGKGAEWMGLPVHSNFRVAVIQTENGEIRIKQDLEQIKEQGHCLKGWYHITPPPRYGMTFATPEFRAQLREWLDKVKPGVFAIDPWNRCIQDDKAKDYTALLDFVSEVLPDPPHKPAVVVIHHLRKPGGNEKRKRGRELLSELSGSYIIGSACRTAFILEPVTPEGDDDRVVLTCAKNNNGEMGSPTAWHRKDSLFVPCEDFDWEEWESEDGMKRRVIEVDDLAAVFENGSQKLTRPEAARALQERTGLGRAAVYRALQADGRYSQKLRESAGLLTFAP